MDIVVMTSINCFLGAFVFKAVANYGHTHCLTGIVLKPQGGLKHTFQLASCVIWHEPPEL